MRLVSALTLCDLVLTLTRFAPGSSHAVVAQLSSLRDVEFVSASVLVSSSYNSCSLTGVTVCIFGKGRLNLQSGSSSATVISRLSLEERAEIFTVGEPTCASSRRQFGGKRS